MYQGWGWRNVLHHEFKCLCCGKQTGMDMAVHHCHTYLGDFTIHHTCAPTYTAAADRAREHPIT